LLILEGKFSALGLCDLLHPLSGLVSVDCGCVQFDAGWLLDCCKLGISWVVKELISFCGVQNERSGWNGPQGVLARLVYIFARVLPVRLSRDATLGTAPHKGGGYGESSDSISPFGSDLLARRECADREEQL